MNITSECLASLYVFMKAALMNRLACATAHPFFFEVVLQADQFIFSEMRADDRVIPVGPVSYTHLDVYKRQRLWKPRC